MGPKKGSSSRARGRSTSPSRNRSGFERSRSSVCQSVSGSSATGAAPATLTPKQNRAIARGQFKRLSKEWQDRVENAIKSKEDYPIDNDLCRLDGEDIISLASAFIEDVEFRGKRQSIEPAVVNAYLKAICRYRNEQDGRTTVLGFGTDVADSLQNPSANGIIDTLQPLLDQEGCSGAQFFDLDYVFFIHGVDGTAHYSLLGVAPKHNAIFWIDGAGRILHKDVSPMRELILTIGHNTILAGKSTDGWEVFCDFVFGEDGSPPCKIQGDSHNCGVYSLTNALCFAFGYDNMCIKSKYLDRGKRRRMLAELDNAGFSPPFNYQLLPLAPKGAWARTWIMNDLGRPGGGEIRYKIDEEGERFSDEEGESEISFAERDVSPSAQDDEDEEMEYSDGRRLRTGVGKCQWKMPRKGNPKKNSYGGGLSEERQPLHNPEGNSKKRVAKKVKGSMEKWPPQFSPQTFKRTAAIFEVKKPLFAELTTKVELKQACRDHGIKKFTWWSEGPKDLFRWWMEQEMAEREVVGEEGEKAAIRSKVPKIAVHNKSARMTRNATRKAKAKNGAQRKRERAEQDEEQRQPRKKTKSVAARVEQEPKAAKKQTAKESPAKRTRTTKAKPGPANTMKKSKGTELT